MVEEVPRGAVGEEVARGAVGEDVPRGAVGGGRSLRSGISPGRTSRGESRGSSWKVSTCKSTMLCRFFL